MEPVLCYVRSPWAYFTTRPLFEQWGDDWNDAPYEHNAGEPYDPCWHNEPKYLNNSESKRGCIPGTQIPLPVGILCQCKSCVRDWNEDGTPKFKIIKVAFDSDLDSPCDFVLNSRYSVEQINAGAVAWLTGKDIIIPAGTTLSEFIRLIRKAGGIIYRE